MVTQRHYQIMGGDYEKVREFLMRTYQPYGYGRWLVERWEYMHGLYWFNFTASWHIGIWEDDGVMVGLATYEDALGDAFLFLDDAYEALFPELLNYAEKYLSSLNEDGTRTLKVQVYQGQDARSQLLQERGYQPDAVGEREDWNIFDFSKPIPDPVLPEGFHILTADQVPEENWQKLVDCIWQGFDHEGSGLADSLTMILALPTARPDLAKVIQADNGDYCCYGGMWLNARNSYAYLEPLCTHPKYRRMGLAKALLYAHMRDVKARGATFMTGGSNAFYRAIGYETKFTQWWCARTWKA